VSEADVNSFVDAADRVGVNHVVYLSTLGAEKNVIIPHHRIEKHIMGTDITYTLLRASFFMQNLLEVHRADIVEHDELFVPAGSGKTSFIDARDISEAAAVVLIEPDHANRAYDLTGPEALDYGAVATTFSEVLGRSITYPNPSLLAFSRRMYQRGTPLGFIALLCGIYTTARLGLAARVTEDSYLLLGRSPRTVRAFIEDHADAFRGDPGRTGRFRSRLFGITVCLLSYSVRSLPENFSPLVSKRGGMSSAGPQGLKRSPKSYRTVSHGSIRSTGTSGCAKRLQSDTIPSVVRGMSSGTRT